jgi:hypothetical protein
LRLRCKNGFVTQQTDIVDAVVGSRIDFRNIQQRAVLNAATVKQALQGLPSCKSRQFTALATSFAQVVLPVPREPTNR